MLIEMLHLFSDCDCELVSKTAIMFNFIECSPNRHWQSLLSLLTCRLAVQKRVGLIVDILGIMTPRLLIYNSSMDSAYEFSSVPLL